MLEGGRGAQRPRYFQYETEDLEAQAEARGEGGCVICDQGPQVHEDLGACLVVQRCGGLTSGRGSISLMRRRASQNRARSKRHRGGRLGLGACRAGRGATVTMLAVMICAVVLGPVAFRTACVGERASTGANFAPAPNGSAWAKRTASQWLDAGDLCDTRCDWPCMGNSERRRAALRCWELRQCSPHGSTPPSGGSRSLSLAGERQARNTSTGRAPHRRTSWLGGGRLDVWLLAGAMVGAWREE